MAEAAHAPLMGHNLTETLIDRLAREYETEQKRAEDLLSGFKNMPVVIEDEETYQKASAFAVQLQKHAKLLDGKHSIEKEPFLRDGRVVDGFFKNPAKDLEDAKRQVEKRQGTYVAVKRAAEQRARDETERLARAEASRLEAEALAAMEKQPDQADDIVEQAVDAIERADIATEEAAAPVTTLQKTHTSFGTVASFNDPWAVEITSKDSLDLNKLRPYLSLDVLDKAAKAYIRAGGRELTGARIFQEPKVRNR